MSKIEVEARLRPKNQVILPEEIATRLQVEPGDRLVFEWNETEPERVEVRRLRRSYYGALEGVYGDTPEEVAAYLRSERLGWEER